MVAFSTKIYHPNVDKEGQICADMLEIGDKWAPVKNLVKIMDKINSLLAAPNLESPMNPDAANDYKNGTWEEKAKATTQQYAKWSQPHNLSTHISTNSISSCVGISHISHPFSPGDPRLLQYFSSSSQDIYIFSVNSFFKFPISSSISFTKAYGIFQGCIGLDDRE